MCDTPGIHQATDVHNEQELCSAVLSGYYILRLWLLLGEHKGELKDSDR